MSTFLVEQTEGYGYETFRCSRCRRNFEAPVITWVDVSKTPKARNAILRLDFNIIRCSNCGSSGYADVPFFYEDFVEGLLIAVLPRTENSGAAEAQIRKRYGHYPHLACLNVTQLWLLVYLQSFYRENRGPRLCTGAGGAEKRAHRLLRFLAHDPVMVVIEEKLNDIFTGDDAEGANLAAVLGQAIYRIEGLHPWPLDRRCICKADISHGLACCGQPMDLDKRKMLSPGLRGLECPRCGKAIAQTVCGRCGRSYTWELGFVESLEEGEDIEHLFLRIPGPRSRIAD